MILLCTKYFTAFQSLIFNASGSEAMHCKQSIFPGTFKIVMNRFNWRSTAAVSSGDQCLFLKSFWSLKDRIMTIKILHDMINTRTNTMCCTYLQSANWNNSLELKLTIFLPSTYIMTILRFGLSVPSLLHWLKKHLISRLIAHSGTIPCRNLYKGVCSSR